MPSAETISEKTVRKTAKAAGKEAAREAFLEMSLEGDETSGLPLEGLDGNSDESLGEAAAGFDIFQDVGKNLAEKGEVLKYIIKREGERVGSKYHPYSWERLAQDYGPGHYQVIARSESRNRFIRSQTQIIGDVGAYVEETETTEETKAGPTPNVGWQTPQMGFLEMWNLMQTQSDRARQEAQQQATQQAQTQVAMITAMTEMMKNQQLQGQQLFMEMTKMTSQVAEKMAQAQEKIMEKLNSRMDKLADLATKKPEGPSWVDVMKLNNESQNKGFELFEKIMRLAELKADEKVELLESAREVGGSGDGEKKKSLTDTLIESLLPVIATSMAAQGQRPMLQQPVALPPTIPQQPLPRRALRQPPTAQAPANGAVQRGPRTPKANPQETRPRQAPAAPTAGKPVVIGGGASVGPSIVIAKGKKETSEGPVKAEPTIADKVEVIETTGTRAEIKTEVKAHCQEILPVFLGGLMLEATEIPVATTKTIEFLNEHGISRELFLKNVEAKDLIDVAKQYELPEEAHQWLNELYANIQDQPRNDARRESAASAEHATA